MKTLFINRHAKSSWDSPSMSDFDRPLNKRGLRDAPKMAQRLLDKKESIDYIVSSPANRAKSTAIIFAQKILGDATLVHFDQKIYESTTRQLLDIVNAFPDDINSAMVFGHNPTLTDFAVYLSGTYISNIPTCGIVKIEFDIDGWREISQDLGRQVYFDYPKSEA